MADSSTNNRRSRARGTAQNANSAALIGFIVGIALGLGGGLFYAWAISPVVSTDVAPWQLNKQGQDQWIIAASMAWAQDGDLLAAANRLNDLRYNEATFQRVADLACELARSSYAQSASGQMAIRSMARLAESQGRRGCATELILINTPTAPPSPTRQPATPSRPPPPSKTPTPEPKATVTPELVLVEPTNTAPPGKFIVVRYEPFCSAKASGVIEVLVTEPNGTTGIAGVEVKVDWGGGSDHFYTGLKPERDNGFADFKMADGQTYTVSLPGLSDASNPITAQPCTDRQGGGAALTSYRLYFRRTPR
jgi:hypothetical protein